MLQHYPLLALMITQLLAVSLPGADFFMIIRQSLKHGRVIGIITALGVTSGAAIYCSATVFGLGWLKANANWLMHTIAILGSLYLIYMGSQCLFKPQPTSAQVSTHSETQLTQKPYHAYLIGLATNLSNPKVVVYYLSILPLFFTTSNSMGHKLALIVVLMAIALIWFVFVALIMGHNKLRGSIQRFIFLVEYVFGVVLWIFAALLLWHFLLSGLV